MSRMNTPFAGAPIEAQRCCGVMFMGRVLSVRSGLEVEREVELGRDGLPVLLQRVEAIAHADLAGRGVEDLRAVLRLHGRGHALLVDVDADDAARRGQVE